MVNADLARAGVVAGNRILDIGAAGGAQAAAMVSGGMRVVAVEPDMELCSEARHAGNASAVSYVRGDGVRLPFAAESFDAVTVIEVLEHVGDPRGLVEEGRRVLRPGGVLLVGIPSAHSERLYNRLHPRYATNATHVRVFEESELLELLRQAGFLVCWVEPRNLGQYLAWILHAALRSEADHTGRLLQHHWVDYLTAGALRGARALPGLATLVRRLELKVGKSVYVLARRPAGAGPV